MHQHFLDCHLPYVGWLKEQGYAVDLAAGEDQKVPLADRQFFLSIQRSPFRWQNIKAYRELKQVLDENQYDLVHCHTPMGAVLARLAARKLRKQGKLKVIYTAHGFHFFKGAPLPYWLIFYPVEKWLSKHTDAIVTINQEDFTLVKNRGFRNKYTYRIDSIGVPDERFSKPSLEEKNSLRQAYGYQPEDFILIYAAEFIPRKNHDMILKALPSLKKEIPDLRVLFPGTGPLVEKIRKSVQVQGFEGQVDFLGFRNDIPQLMALSDACISSSRQEGYGMHIAEAMFSGLPAVATEDRGHREMIVNGHNGYLFPQDDPHAFAQNVITLYKNPELRKTMGENALASIQKCAIRNSLEKMKEVYRQFLGD